MAEIKYWMKNSTDGRRYDVAAIGSLTIDLHSYTSQLPKRNQIVSGHHFSADYGGIAGNQAYMASLLGSSTVLLVQKGEDLFGQSYTKYLEDNKIDVIEPLLVQDCEKKITMAQLITNTDGDNFGAVVDFQTQNFTDDVFLASKALMTAMKSSRVLIASLTIPIQTIRRALHEAAVVGVLTILNLAPTPTNLDDIQYIRDALTDCHVVVVNEAELAAIFQRSNVSMTEEIEELINDLYDDGCQFPIVTLGNNGAMFRNPKDGMVARVPAPVVDAVDSIGAGDCFIGSLAHFLAQTNDGFVTKEMIQMSVHLASSSVTKHGTQKSYPTRLEITEILSKLKR